MDQLVGTSSASMLPTALSYTFFTHARVIGASQGDISNSANTEDSLGPLSVGIPAFLENRISVLNFENTLTKRVNSGGIPNGGVVIEPSKFLKYIDRSSPLLLRAHDNNETLTIEIEHYRSNPIDESLDLYYTQEFANCKVLAIRHVGPYLEEIEFYCTGLTATHVIEATASTVP